ncbi:MarR family winged helix-turn-helix transcriptional regulator [Krasilnikoviella flava]|uniref:DNA-binding transcriptional regulator, MarR family n=1 Tax=Krasilnikoviella flava TaxID=526729 RepID=A0A1T5JG08_9MICO|nr:MarR family transcriptional regulator [Krasilnikoviella flava]SKC50380.1 DNA-binding transcriptional regulator, MarR family [Krasilnikoviella flava]
MTTTRGTTATDEPRWLDAEQMRTWLRLQAVIELLPAALDQQLRRDSDLTHFEYMVLAMLSEAPERALRMTELARLTSATLPRLSHVARRLEARGYVERCTAPDDRRATISHLTEDGWRKVVASAPGHARTVLEDVFDDLDADEVAALAGALGKVLAHLDPHDRFGLEDGSRRPQAAPGSEPVRRRR